MKFQIRWDLNNPYKRINFSDPDELIGIVVRQRFEEQRVDDAENRRVRADAQGERKHGYA